jgi:histidine ammonia-lyase
MDPLSWTPRELRHSPAPVSLELASSAHAEGSEDEATLVPLAARRLMDQLALGQRIVALELVVAAQAVHLRALERLGRGTAGSTS